MYHDQRSTSGTTRRSDSGLPSSAASSNHSYSDPRRHSYGHESLPYSSSTNDYNRTTESKDRSYDRDPVQDISRTSGDSRQLQPTTGDEKTSTKLSTTARAELRAGAPIPAVEQTVNELVDYQKAGDNQFAGARFIFEIGIKLEVQPITIATAASIYHRFWKVASPQDYDIYDVAGTSILIAAKAESETKVRIRDIINVVHHTLNRGAEMLVVGDENYQMYKQGLISHELVILRMLKFKTDFDNPHKYLVHYLQSIHFWKGFYQFTNKYPKFMQIAWSCMQDFYHHPECVDYSAKAIAVAAIDLSADFHNTDLSSPNAKHRTWQNVCFDDYIEETNVEIKIKMLEAYELEEEVLSKYRYGSKPPLSALSTNHQSGMKQATTPVPVPPPAPIISGRHHGPTSSSSASGRGHSAGTGVTPGRNRSPPPPRRSRSRSRFN